MPTEVLRPLFLSEKINLLAGAGLKIVAAVAPKREALGAVTAMATFGAAVVSVLDAAAAALLQVI